MRLFEKNVLFSVPSASFQTFWWQNVVNLLCCWNSDASSSLDSAHQRFFSRDFATSDRKVVEKMSDRQQKTLFFLNYIIYSILDEFEITEFTDDGSIWWRTNRTPYNSYMD